MCDKSKVAKRNLRCFLDMYEVKIFGTIKNDFRFNKREICVLTLS